MMTTRRLLATLGGCAAILSFGIGCSSDSPTAPVQQAGSPAGVGAPSAVWNITVTVDPSELSINATQPATVAVTVRRADNGQAPPSGSTILVSTSLGDFDSFGSGATSVPLVTVGGQASTFLFAGPVSGTALVSAQLEASVGQRSVRFIDVVDQIQASFTFQNSESDTSVQFLDTSTGDPTEFLWDFGDGTTSTERNPAHIFPREGDYAVTLTASKAGSTSFASQIVAVGTIEALVANFEFINSEDNLSVKFLNTSTGNPISFLWDFGDGQSSSEENPDHLFGIDGDYVVTLTISDGLDSSTISKIVTVGLPTDLFIDFIDPNTGRENGGTTVTITGNNFAQLLRVFFGAGLGDVVSVTTTQVVVRTPAFIGEFDTVACDTNPGAPGVAGVMSIDTAVNVTVEIENGPSDSISAGFFYKPSDTSCRDSAAAPPPPI